MFLENTESLRVCFMIRKKFRNHLESICKTSVNVFYRYSMGTNAVSALQLPSVNEDDEEDTKEVVAKVKVARNDKAINDLEVKFAEFSLSQPGKVTRLLSHSDHGWIYDFVTFANLGTG